MTDSRVEALAAELVALPLAELSPAETDQRITAIIGDSDVDIARAALDRAAEIMKRRTAAAVKHAEMLAAMSRLAAATHCPDNADVAEWLLGLGLVERDGLGYRLTPKATLRAVCKDSP